MGRLWLACFFVLISVGQCTNTVRITVGHCNRLEFGAGDCDPSLKKYYNSDCHGACTGISYECRRTSDGECYECHYKGVVCKIHHHYR